MSRSAVTSFMRNANRILIPQVSSNYQKMSIRACSTISDQKIDSTSENMNDKHGLAMNSVKEIIMTKLGIQKGFTPLVSTREHLSKYEPLSRSELPVRSMQDSFTSAIIPLSADSELQDKYVTFLGHVRLGRLMEDMDLFAVWVVHKHLHLPTLPKDTPLPYTFVTCLVDKIDFTDLKPKHDADIRLSGHVSWVGSSSIEVVVWLEQKVYGKYKKLTRALFLMAARNATNTKALVVNQLIPSNDEEKRIFEGGANRKKQRIQRQGESILKVEPNQYEQKLIHDLFIKTIDLNDPSFNKRTLPLHSEWMENLKLSNIIFSHPEDRNAHNKVFGGFLMRHALELSWACAYMFTKYRPKLSHISDIGFHQPVDVSSFIKMHAHIIYTEMQYMEIVVVAEVFDAKTGGHNTTNMFYYTYSNDEKVPQIIPKTYQEAMLYVDGRRKFNYSMGLNEDAKDNNIHTLSSPRSSL